MLAVAAFGITVFAGLLLRPSSPAQTLSVQTAPASEQAAPRDAGEAISIPSLGLSITRPAGWTTVTADQNARNLASVRMDDPEFQQLARAYAAAPIVAMAKYPEPFDDLNPTVKINVRPLGGLAGRAPEEILGGAIPLFRRGFGDVKVLAGPKRTGLAGKPAGFARLSYTLRNTGGEFPTVSEIWVVPSGSVYFMIGTGTRADEKTGTRAEARAILDSLRIQ